MKYSMIPILVLLFVPGFGETQTSASMLVSHTSYVTAPRGMHIVNEGPMSDGITIYSNGKMAYTDKLIASSTPASIDITGNLSRCGNWELSAVSPYGNALGGFPVTSLTIPIITVVE